MGILTRTGHLWDLRRGDADDDRSSPQGRGWRALAISTALEFNLLTAAVAFVLLIVGPALIVGLAIPATIMLARQKIDTVTLITTRPAAALIALGVLAAAALWIARPLLAIALDNFWHLHYTLVFPPFVALRETISAGLERLPSRRPDPMLLHRLRRAGAVLATLLLAGCGLMLAWNAGFVADVRTVNARVLAGVALGNAAFVLGVSAMAASLMWSWREITSGQPVLDWEPGTRSPGAHAPAARLVRVAHLSDLHVVGERYGYRMESGTSGPCGNGRAARALSGLDALDAAQPVDRILVSGDITDAGTRAEWVEFLDLLERRPGLRDRLLFVPGNHDVNVVDRSNPGRLDVPWSSAQALRKLRVVLAMDAVQGQRAHVVEHTSGRPGPTLEEYLRTGERPALLRDLAQRGTWRGRWEIVKLWDEIFPLVLPPSDDGCGVILLDSNARRHFSLTNAIGVIGRGQLRRLAAVLRAGQGRPWIVLVHHHVVEYPIPYLGMQERVGVVLVNGADVLRVIAAHGTRAVVLHGHRHRDWIGTSSDVLLCSAASVTLGDKGSTSRAGSFSLYDIAVSPDGQMRLAASRRVTVADELDVRSTGTSCI